MNRRLVALVAAFVLLVSGATPGMARVSSPGPDTAPAAVTAVTSAAKPAPVDVQSAPSSLPTSPVDQSKVPHYFGPYPNWANSQFTLPDVAVTIGGDGAGAAATASVGANGAVTGITLTSPGTGYTTATVTFGGAGNGATATATVATSGAVTSVTLDTAGAGYTTPTVSFSGGGGAGTLTQVGNALQDRSYATDFPPEPSPKPVLVVLPTLLPAGTLTDFLTWNQPAAGGSPASAGETFYAYVLRPTALPDEYTVVFASSLLTVPALADPAVAQIATYNVGSVPVQAGDVIGFYGAGIPLDTGVATPDTASYPAPVAPVLNDTVAFGGAGFPLLTDARNYAFAASVVQPGTMPVRQAAATAFGSVNAIALTDPGNGYSFPTVDIDFPDAADGVQAAAHAVCVEENCAPATDGATVTITGIAIDNPGSGYSAAPNVVIRNGTIADPVNPPADFAPAAASATLAISSIVVDDPGDGYITAPTVTIGGTNTTPATATATVNGGAITGLDLTAAGSGYITPGIKKFEDALPGLCAPPDCPTTGKYIPVAVPEVKTYPPAPDPKAIVADEYEIGLIQYRTSFSSSLPATMVRGYIQLETPANAAISQHWPVTNTLMDGTQVPVYKSDGVTQWLAVTAPQWLGPTIAATKDKAVRIVFHNLLPTGADGDLFLPVDSSLMGSGYGPGGMGAFEDGTVLDEVRNPVCSNKDVTGFDTSECYRDNRATLHLHGGITPWISDGTPHQWITPAGETTNYPQGVSVGNVPDMNVCEAADDGCQTFYYTNQQSARLMFYHDHAWGITRLNVYAGEAAGYLISDDTEKALVNSGTIPADQIPLVVQDRTFVPDAVQLAQQDPTWDTNRWGGMGNFWYHHVYMPAQNPGDPGGMSSYGRWMYGPWFWPPATPPNGPIDNPYYNMDPKGPDGTLGTADDFSTPLAVPCSLDDPATWQYDTDPFCEPLQIPGTPNISVGMEQFNDTPIVNGVAYPTVTLQPKTYRFRVLNAANDRFFNFQWYVGEAATASTGLNKAGDVIGATEVALKPAEVAAAQTDPVVFPTPVAANVNTAGPDWIQIGTEGGFLPAPVVVDGQQPTTWITDPTRFDVGNVDLHSLLLAPAERADAIVDFSKFAGKTLILYNDAPAAFPARVPSYDYYTGAPDQFPNAAPGILPGYGPNTRTIMQVKIAAATPAPAFNLTKLRTAFTHKANGSGAFESGQHPVIVGQAAYNSAYGTTFAASSNCNTPGSTLTRCDGLVRINDGTQVGSTWSFNTLKAPNAKMSMELQPKAIHDEMNSAAFDEFGRMTANLGIEAKPPTPAAQNVTLYPYINPATELIDATNLPKNDVLYDADGNATGDVKIQSISSASDGTQIWRITHNGVDTHPIHFHLYDVQVLNRVTWDNIVIPTEPTELGWKDTVRISPLEDTIVALRPIIPELPWELPNAIRPLSPMMPEGFTNPPATPNIPFNNVNPQGQPTTAIVNELANFGWEYVYHCHILSHEEMDMMRPVLVAMPPVKADTLSFDRLSKTLTWRDASIAETSFDAQVSTDAGATWATFGTIADPLSKPNVLETRSLPYPAYDPDTIYQFQVVAKNTVGYGGAFPEMTVQSVSAPLTVGLETTTTLTSDINPSTVGQNVTFTATVSPAAATGTVTFSDGATVLGTGTLTGGVATFSTSTLALGTHPITAAYGGDATYSNSTSLPLDQVVTQIDTATVVLGAPNPSLVGDSVTFTATVTPAAATGTVTFNIDGTDIVSPPTLVGGVATYTISTLTAGSHPIIATYSGDGTYLPSSDTTTQVVNLIPTTTTLASVPNPSLFGQDVVFTATVSPAAAGGTVTFTVDGTAGTPVAVATGQASFTAAGLSVGAHTVIAAYSGDATYEASTSAPYAQGVGLALTTTTVVSDINPSDLGQQVTFTATVSPAAATGAVEFFDGATSLGTAPLVGSTAGLPFASLAVGTHAITAVYGGDPSYAGSTSAAITQTVNQVPTTTTLASSLNPSILGDNVTFTVTLSTSFATGTVTFSIDGVAGAPVSVAAGSASFSTAALGVGAHTITAVYSGDATYLGSTDTLTQTVNKAPTATLVTSSLNPSILGQNVTFTATVLPSAATGTVTFTVDGTAGAPVTLAAGSASISTATLAVGVHTITAAYSGDGTYAASISDPFTQTVDPLPAPTNLTAVAVSSTQINLAWLGNPPSETGYTLQRATNLAFTSGLNTITLAANTNIYTNTGRAPSTTYYYRIQAFNALGVSAWSNVASAFTAVAGSPAAPSNLGATAFSKAQIDLAWTDNATDETGFTIQRSGNANFTGVTTITQNVVDLATYSDTGRTANTLYYYRVRAFNVVGPSAWSNTASATTLPLAPPAAPSGLSALAVSPSQINLAWTDNATNETGFTIQRSTSSAFTGGVTTITQNVVDLQAYNNTGRAQNTTYYYRVRAFNADGFSTWSNTASATTPPTNPAVPAGLAAAPAAPGNLAVTWTYTSNGALGPITFTLQRSNTGTGGWTTVSTGGTALSVTDGALPTGTTRYYRVRSVNTTGQSAWSAVSVGAVVP